MMTTSDSISVPTASLPSNATFTSTMRTSLPSKSTTTTTIVTSTSRHDEEYDDLLMYSGIGVASSVALIIFLIVVCFVCRSRRQAQANVKRMEKARNRSSCLQYSDVTNTPVSQLREIHSPIYDTDPERVIVATQPDPSEAHVYENTDVEANSRAEEQTTTTSTETNTLATDIGETRKIPIAPPSKKMKRKERRDSNDSYEDPNQVNDLRKVSDQMRGRLVKQNCIGSNDDVNVDYENSATLSVRGNGYDIDAFQPNNDIGRLNSSDSKTANLETVKGSRRDLRKCSTKKETSSDAFDGRKPNIEICTNDLDDYENVFGKVEFDKEFMTDRPNGQMDDGKGSMVDGDDRTHISPLSPTSTKKISNLMNTHTKHKRRKRNKTENIGRSKTTTAIPSTSVYYPARKISEPAFAVPSACLPSPCSITQGYVNVQRNRSVGPATAPKPGKDLECRSVSWDAGGRQSDPGMGQDELYLDMEVSSPLSSTCNVNIVIDGSQGEARYSNQNYEEDMYVPPLPDTEEKQDQRYVNVLRMESPTEGYSEANEVRMLKL